MLWVATAIFAATTYLNNDPVYGAVIVWASLGIKADNVLGSAAVETSTNAIIGLMSAFDLYIAFG